MTTAIRSLSLLVLVAFAGCGAGRTDRSSAIARDIQTGGAEHIRQVTNSVGRAGSATISHVRCVPAAAAQSYSCLVHYTYQNSEGTYHYEIRVSGTCDSGTRCRWHVDGSGTLVGAEPD